MRYHKPKAANQVEVPSQEDIILQTLETKILLQEIDGGTGFAIIDARVLPVRQVKRYNLYERDLAEKDLDKLIRDCYWEALDILRDKRLRETAIGRIDVAKTPVKITGPWVVLEYIPGGQILRRFKGSFDQCEKIKDYLVERFVKLSHKWDEYLKSMIDPENPGAFEFESFEHWYLRQPYDYPKKTTEEALSAGLAGLAGEQVSAEVQ